MNANIPILEGIYKLKIPSVSHAPPKSDKGAVIHYI